MGNLDLLEDAAEKLPHTTRKMFGGHGLFAPNGGMFAGIVTDDAIMLKFADESARADFEAVGGHAWIYVHGSREMTMKEWIIIPDALYDDPRELAKWAARAHRLVPGKVAKSAKSAKGSKAARSMPTPPQNAALAKKAAPARKAAPAKKAAPKKRPMQKAAPKKAIAKAKAPAKKTRGK